MKTPLVTIGDGVACAVGVGCMCALFGDMRSVETLVAWATSVLVIFGWRKMRGRTKSKPTGLGNEQKP